MNKKNDEAEYYLQKYYKEAYDILTNLGYEINNKSICFNNRLKTTLGQYYFDTKTIEINKKFFLKNDKKKIMNIIIHELSHDIADGLYGSDYTNGGHTSNWQKIANDINSKTKYKVTISYRYNT